VHAALGLVHWHADDRLTCGVVPVYVEPPGRPVCVQDERAETIIAYLDRIGIAAGLPALTWTRASPDRWMCT
jgi:poly-gamma-glutamate synthesis protein (capsule biosynthesis protein)